MREKSGCRRGKSSASLSRREDSAAGSNASLLITVRYVWSCCDAVLRQVADGLCDAVAVLWYQ